MIKKLARLANIIDQKGVVGELLSNREFSVAAWQINKGLRHYIPKICTIVDCGANNGQFSLAAHARHDEATIFSFEPVPSAFQRLQRATERFDRIHPFNFGLSNSEGFIDFYEDQYSQASSGLKPIEKDKSRGSISPNIKRIKVPVRRLDAISELSEIERPILLKLDVQGYEKKVLEGATGILEAVDHIVLETAFEPLYEDQPLFNEMNQFLEDLGFTFIAPLDFHINNHRRIEEMDVLYKRL